MSRRGDGKWVEAATRISADLPPDKKKRRAMIIQRCEAGGLDERIVSRMISARDYAIKFIDERDVRASHRTVEALMSLERMDGDRAAAIREAVLRGDQSRAAVDEGLRDATAAQAARKGRLGSMPLARVIDLCCAELRGRVQIQWTPAPNFGPSFLLGADAEYTLSEIEFDESGAPRSTTITPVWALTISPHIRCSRIFGSGEREFLRSIAALSCQYRLVSIFCSSEHEVKETRTMIAQCLTLCSHELKHDGKFVFHVSPTSVRTHN